MSAIDAPGRHGRRPRVVALGDSISCGEGVGVSVHLAHTWAAVVAHSLGGELDLLATRGARIADVRLSQLPLALARRPDVATLIVGLNDISRGGWDEPRMRADLHTVVGALRAQGVTVVLGRLHDPTALLPMPARIRQRIGARIAAVNAAVDASIGPDVLLLDLARIPQLRNRGSWAVDRVHPSIAGHRAVAEAALDILEANDVRVAERVPIRPAAARCSRLAEVRWLARYGAPYLVRNLDRVRQPVGADAG
ncbi:MAG TPA: SGNH/GDSL hydrolase family protein [Jatrophihabitantaceae bacterium]|nr:SGNH/GDSL hydrolase family protein [Jatrophihabitantaceae bacterium]